MKITRRQLRRLVAETMRPENELREAMSFGEIWDSMKDAWGFEDEDKKAAKEALDNIRREKEKSAHADQEAKLRKQAAHHHDAVIADKNNWAWVPRNLLPYLPEDDVYNPGPRTKGVHSRYQGGTRYKK